MEHHITPHFQITPHPHIKSISHHPSHHASISSSVIDQCIISPTVLDAGCHPFGVGEMCIIATSKQWVTAVEDSGCKLPGLAFSILAGIKHAGGIR